MPAAKKNLVIEQKATFRKRLIWRDARKRAIDLTGYTARMQVRDAAGELLADLSTENGLITLGAAPGAIDLLIQATQTRTMSFQQALYDLKMIAPDGTEIRLLEGRVTLSLGQTE